MKTIYGIIVTTILSLNSYAIEVVNEGMEPVVYVTEEDGKQFELERNRALASAETKIHPTKEFSIIVTKEGYYPKTISVFEDEKVRFFVTNLTNDPACVIVTGHEVFLAAEKDKITEGEVVFKTHGVYPFYCPSSKHRGDITVIQRKKKIIERKVASEEGPAKEGPWMPKDK
jgi:hypothetical protein